jgi:hypothetical protein
MLEQPKDPECFEGLVAHIKNTLLVGRYHLDHKLSEFHEGQYHVVSFNDYGEYEFVGSFCTLDTFERWTFVGRPVWVNSAYVYKWQDNDFALTNYWVRDLPANK